MEMNLDIDVAHCDGINLWSFEHSKPGELVQIPFTEVPHFDSHVVMLDRETADIDVVVFFILPPSKNQCWTT